MECGAFRKNLFIVISLMAIILIMVGPALAAANFAEPARTDLNGGKGYVSPKPGVYDSGTNVISRSSMLYPAPLLQKELAAPAQNPVTGEVKVLAVMMDFTDTVFDATYTPEYFRNKLFGSVPFNSLAAYYSRNSYGKITITGDVYQVTSAYTMSYYGADGIEIDGANGPIELMAAEAASLLDPSMDFSDYDSDGDGYIDHFMIIHAGSGQEAVIDSNLIWSHAYATPDTAIGSTGQLVSNYITVPEDGELGVIAHEFGHDLGLPDLYDTDGEASGGDSGAVGLWDVMANGSWLNDGVYPANLSAWSKAQLNWVNLQDVTVDGIYGIESAEVSDTVYRLAYDGTDQYFLLENRQEESLTMTYMTTGLLIWRINDNVGDLTSNAVNVDPDNPRVALVEAHSGLEHGIDDLHFGLLNSGDMGDPFPGATGNFSFSALSTPNSYRYYDGFAQGEWSFVDLFITDISGENIETWIEVEKAAPGIPVIASPADLGVVNTATPQLEWSHEMKAQWYQLQVDDSADFLNPVVDQVVYGELFTMPELLDGAYYWRVAACNEMGTSGYTGIKVFSVNTTGNLNVLPPVLSPDNLENELGRPIEINFLDDSTWRSAITSVKVNEVTVVDGVYVGEGFIRINSEWFPTAGEYDITIEAQGYYSAVVTQEITQTTVVWDGIELVSGSSPTSPVEIKVFEAGGLVQVQVWASETEMDLSTIGVDETTRFKIDLRLFNGFEPRVLLGAGKDVTWEISPPDTGVGQDYTTVSIYTYAIPAQFIMGQETNPWPVENDIADTAFGAIVSLAIDSLSTMDASQQALLDGAILVTDAQTFSPPQYNPGGTGQPPVLSMSVGGPHFKVDGVTENAGFFEAHLPQALLDSWGVTDPRQLTVAYGTELAPKVVLEPGGMRMDFPIHYSTGTVSLSSDTQAPTVTATPAGGSYNSAQSVTLTANEAATIYYTVDGTEPSTGSAQYSTPISINASTILKFIAVDTAGNQSAVFTESYTIGSTSTGNDSGSSVGSGSSPAPSETTAPPQEVTVPADALETVTSQVDGQSIIEVNVNPSVLKNILAKNKNAETITIPVSASGDVKIANLTASSLSDLENNNNKLAQVQTDNASYMLPVAEVPLERLAEQIGAKVNDLTVKIVIARPNPDILTAMEKTAAEQGLTQVSVPVEFKVEVTSGDKKAEVSSFGSYVTRTVTLNKEVNPKNAVGVMMNPDGSLSPVPTQFKTVNGKQVAVLKRKGNSIYTVIEYNKAFTDVNGHWAMDAINTLASKLIISGMSDDYFAPEGKVTRAQFATMLVRALGLEPMSTKASFNDIKATDWFAGSVGAAVDAGIVKGYKDNTFRPNSYVTREEVAAMIVNALKAAGVDVTIDDEEVVAQLGKFADKSELNSWAKEAVALAAKFQIVNGNAKGNFLPAENASRAESTVMIKQLLKKAEFI